MIRILRSMSTSSTFACQGLTDARSEYGEHRHHGERCCHRCSRDGRALELAQRGSGRSYCRFRAPGAGDLDLDALATQFGSDDTAELEASFNRLERLSTEMNCAPSRVRISRQQRRKRQGPHKCWRGCGQQTGDRVELVPSTCQTRARVSSSTRGGARAARNAARDADVSSSYE